MEIVSTMMWIATVLNLIAFGLNIYSFMRYNKLTQEIIKDQTYPEYYKDVWIYYCLPGETVELVEKAWLSVNDNGEYIWTRSDTEQIIPNEWVTKWEYDEKR